MVLAVGPGMLITGTMPSTTIDFEKEFAQLPKKLHKLAEKLKVFPAINKLEGMETVRKPEASC